MDGILEFAAFSHCGEIVFVNGLDRKIGGHVPDFVQPELLPVSYLRSVGVKHVGGTASSVNGGQVVPAGCLNAFVVKSGWVHHRQPELFPRPGRPSGSHDDGISGSPTAVNRGDVEPFERSYCKLAW